MLNKKILSVIVSIIIAVIAWYNSESDNSNQTVEIPTDGETMVVKFVDVGQGDCEIVMFPNGKTMLIDAGTTSAEDTLPEYLRNLGIEKLDYIIGTHPHEDHIGGLDAVIKSFDVGQIYMSKAETTTKTYKDVLTAIKNKGVTINTAKAGKVIIDDDSIKAELLAPNSDKYEELNNYSAVLKLQYGETSFLFTGDAEVLSEEEMMRNFGKAKLNSDVLKMGHHGSSTSSSEEFFNAVSPDTAVISCGIDNDYGHPHREIRSLLEKYNTTVYRTDQNGTITAISDGQNIEFLTEK